MSKFKKYKETCDVVRSLGKEHHRVSKFLSSHNRLDATRIGTFDDTGTLSHLLLLLLAKFEDECGKLPPFKVERPYLEETDAERRTAFSQEQRRNSRQQKVHHSRKEKDSDVLSREEGELFESVGESTGTKPGRSRHNARAISARGFSRSRSRTSLRREIKDSQPTHSPARIDQHRDEQSNPKGQQPKHMGRRQREVQAGSPENHSRNRERRGSSIRVSPPINRRIIQRNRSRSDVPHDRRGRKQQQSSYEQDLEHPSGRERQTRSRSRSREKNAPTDDIRRHYGVAPE